MGPQEDYIETVVTCEGDFHDPQLQDRLQHFQQRLESLLLEDGKKQLILKKVEPWNSVRVTFSIPRQAALRLKQMAQQGSPILRQIGVLGVQIQGDRLVSLTVATSNNQRAELIINTHESSGQGSAVVAQQSVSVGTSFDPGMPSSSEEQGSPGPNMEVTRKNIEEYLRQGALFNSVPTPACAPGHPRSGSSHDVLKTSTSADGTAFKINNIALDGMPGPSSLPGIPERPAFLTGDGHGPGPMAVQQGVNVPVSGQRGPRMSVAQHSTLQPPKCNTSQQKQQHQQLAQLSAQATALPQTAAYPSLMGLPPPPPYPHGHGTGVANNVGRQVKKPPASSPLLINLLQTEPVAGSNNIMAAPGAEKKVKKHRRRKEKPASAAAVPDGQATTQSILSLPPESDSIPDIVPPQTMPSQEEMSAVLHRRVSPVPLPSPRLGAGFSNSVPMPADLGSEGFRDRNSSTASAALVSLAQNQKSTPESEQVSDSNSIINPYTGHMEPRDSASDLSPVKQDQHKPRKSSLTEGSRNETSVSGVGVNTQVSLAAAKVELSSSDSVRLGLGSLQPGATVPSSLREERPRGYPSSMITSVVSSEQKLVSDSFFRQSPDAGHARVTPETSTVPSSAAPHIYAQRSFGPSQPLSRATHVAPQHSTHTHTSKAGTSAVNGPINVTTPPSSYPVSGQLSTESRLPMSRLSAESGLVDPYHLASHKARSSVHGDVVHDNVSVSHEAKLDDTGSTLCGGAGSHQPVTASTSLPLTHKAKPVLEMQTSVASVSTLAAQAQSDSLKLLNNSSSVSSGVVLRLPTDSAIPTASTASPAAIKTPSDGEDNNSNHSGISPVSTVAPAPSSLLDTNGTKVDNHDSGMGSSSERSDDTTPSEVGDGDFHTSVPTSESSTTDNNSSKSAVVVKKTMINCKETSGSSDAHTITVGYVQMNQHSTDPYNKETKKHMVDASPLIGDKSTVDETLREVSNLVKSAPSMMPTSSQVALASHKDISESLPLATKINNLPCQQVVVKHKATANHQVSDIHQNGPTSLPPVVQSQHLQGQHLPTSMHTSVHHSTGIAASHHQNQFSVSHQPASVVNNSVTYQQPESVPNSQSSGGWPHQTSSIPSSLSQGGLLPSSVHSQVVRTGLPLPSGQPQGSAPYVPRCVASEAVSVSPLSSACNSQSTSGPPLHNASQTAGSSAGLSKNKAHNMPGKDLTSSTAQELYPSGNPLSSQTQRVSSQGHTGQTPNASHRTLTLHSVTTTSGHSQQTATGGSLCPPAHCSSITAGLTSHAQGSSFQGSSSQAPISQSSTVLVPVSQDPAALSQPLQGAGSKLEKIPTPLPSSSTSTGLKTTAAMHTISAAGPHLTSSQGSHPVKTTHNVITSNAVHSVSREVEGRSHVVCTSFSGSHTSGGDLLKHPSSNTSSSNSITVSSVSGTSGLDLETVTSDLVPDTSLGDFALLEDSNPHGDDVLSAEDLALISEPGLSAYLDEGVRHGTTNGNMSVSSETRAGVNITSMYTKRSSPINVNMLNHIYAAGLPQPRRLTESVQRLVKPLPNPENSLLPGRACKSPSASSRHSSNGSGSPGRASQGGSRSLAASLSVTSPARNLMFDKLVPNLSTAVHNSSGSASSGSNSLTPHLAHPSFGGGLNCINTSVIPAAPHPLATLQSSASSRHKAGNGSGVPATVSVSLSATSLASSVAIPSSSAISFSSSLSSCLSSTLSTGSNSAVSSHTHGNSSAVLKDSLSSRLQQEHTSYTVSGPVSKHSVPSTAIFHHPLSHQSSSVSVAQPDVRQPESTAEDSFASRVSSPAVSSLPSSVSAVCNRVAVRPQLQAVLPNPHSSSVSVCNTSFVESVTGKSNIRSSPCVKPVLTSLSSGHHSSSASLSSPVVSSSSAGGVHVHHMPAACSSCTHLQNSSVTSVSSSFDLSPHVTAVSSVCSKTSAASKPADFPLTPRLIISVGHPVTSSSQQVLAVSGSLSTGTASFNTDVLTRTSTEEKFVCTGETSASALKSSTIPSSQSDNLTEVTSSGRTVPLTSSPVTSSQRDSHVITTVSSMVDSQSVRPLSQTITSTSDSCAPEAVSVTESLSNRIRLKDAGGEEKVDVEMSRSANVPVTQHSLQDSTSNSQFVQSENPHSKPPLLHPAPPLTLPALIPSATPPPPPLTPVLLQDTSKKETNSSPIQAPPASNMVGEAEGTSCVQERTDIVSAFFHACDPAVAAEKNEIPESMVSGHETEPKDVEAIPRDATHTHAVSNDTGDSEASEPPASLSLDESNLKTRRLTRKRKSTNSESDTSSEPAPKLSCVENSVSSGNSTDSSKTGTSSDLPPKLQKEGKKSQLIEKPEDDKGGKKAEDRPNKKEEEEKGGKKEEEKAGVKNTTHHDRNILDATPEEVAKKMAAAGSKRRVHYTYVLEKVSPGQSYFDTPVLSGRTRSQGSKGTKESSSASTGVTTTTSTVSSASQGAQSGGTGKDDTGETAAAGSKRSTRSLRTKDAGESTQTKRKRAKEHR
ncbi:uncharacterized protein LOC143280106 [Babylonia areolata]|uniref:uncharacterized protein LOC143280106 n=1 Tax=Babylonia areolata TaxID=304850 RepID=UPI003FD27199